MKISHVLTILVMVLIVGGAVLFLRKGEPDTVKDDKMEMIEKREEPVWANSDEEHEMNETVAESNNSNTGDSVDYNIDYDADYDTDYDVDARIREVIEADEYISSSILERKAIVEQLLDELQEKGLIKDIYFSEEDDLFSFEYYDGTLGGVMLRDFGSEEEPMN